MWEFCEKEQAQGELWSWIINLEILLFSASKINQVFGVWNFGMFNYSVSNNISLEKFSLIEGVLLF